jgi:hypothetical protein
MNQTAARTNSGLTVRETTAPASQIDHDKIPLMTLCSVNAIPSGWRNPIYEIVLEKLMRTTEGQALQFERPKRWSKSGAAVRLRNLAKHKGFRPKINVRMRDGVVYVWLTRE